MSKRNGYFITIEGCDGSGKSHHSRRLIAALKDMGYNVTGTREPGGTPTAEKIRELLLNKSNTMLQQTECLLYTAARIEHYYEVIKPALDRGDIVICDRFIDSTIAYQGYAGGLSEDYILKLFELTTPDAMPDLTLFLDISAKEAFDRKGGVDGADRQELKGFEFHQKVYNGFKQLAARFPGRIVTIDARGSKDETAKIILEQVLSRIQK